MNPNFAQQQRRQLRQQLNNPPAIPQWIMQMLPQPLQQQRDVNPKSTDARQEGGAKKKKPQPKQTKNKKKITVSSYSSENEKRMIDSSATKLIAEYFNKKYGRDAEGTLKLRLNENIKNELKENLLRTGEEYAPGSIQRKIFIKALEKVDEFGKLKGGGIIENIKDIYNTFKRVGEAMGKVKQFLTEPPKSLVMRARLGRGKKGGGKSDNDDDSGIPIDEPIPKYNPEGYKKTQNLGQKEKSISVDSSIEINKKREEDLKKKKKAVSKTKGNSEALPNKLTMQKKEQIVNTSDDDEFTDGDKLKDENLDDDSDKLPDENLSDSGDGNKGGVKKPDGKTKYTNWGEVTINIPEKLLLVRQLKKGTKEYEYKPLTEKTKNVATRQINKVSTKAIKFEIKDNDEEPKIINKSNKWGELVIAVPKEMLYTTGKNGKLERVKDTLTKSHILSKVKGITSIKIRPTLEGKVFITDNEDKVINEPKQKAETKEKEKPKKDKGKKNKKKLKKYHLITKEEIKDFENMSSEELQEELKNKENEKFDLDDYIERLDEDNEDDKEEIEIKEDEREFLEQEINLIEDILESRDIIN